MSKQPPLPVRLIDWTLSNSHYPATITGATVLLVLLALYFFSGVLFPDLAGSRYQDALEITGVFLLMALLPAYLIMCLIVNQRSNDCGLEQLQDRLPGDHDLSGRYAGAQHWFWVLPAAWTYALTVNVNWNPVTFDSADPGFTLSVMLIVGQLLLWTVVGVVLFFALHQCWYFNRLGRVVRIDLYQPNALNPFGRTALNNFLIVVGALALTVVQALDREFRAENYLNALYVGLPAALIMVTLPIWPIHRRMKQARTAALADLETDVAKVSRELDQESLQRLNALLARRDYLQSVRTWPMDLSIFSRFVLYVFIPPVAWVGAALVEFFLDSMLNG